MGKEIHCTLCLSYLGDRVAADSLSCSCSRRSDVLKPANDFYRHAHEKGLALKIKSLGRKYAQNERAFVSRCKIGYYAAFDGSVQCFQPDSGPKSCFPAATEYAVALQQGPRCTPFSR